MRWSPVPPIDCKRETHYCNLKRGHCPIDWEVGGMSKDKLTQTICASISWRGFAIPRECSIVQRFLTSTVLLHNSLQMSKVPSCVQSWPDELSKTLEFMLPECPGRCSMFLGFPSSPTIFIFSAKSWGLPATLCANPEIDWTFWAPYGSAYDEMLDAAPCSKLWPGGCCCAENAPVAPIPTAGGMLPVWSCWTGIRAEFCTCGYSLREVVGATAPGCRDNFPWSHASRPILGPTLENVALTPDCEAGDWFHPGAAFIWASCGTAHCPVGFACGRPSCTAQILATWKHTLLWTDKNTQKSWADEGTKVAVKPAGDELRANGWLGHDPNPYCPVQCQIECLRLMWSIQEDPTEPERDDDLVPLSVGLREDRSAALEAQGAQCQA